MNTKSEKLRDACEVAAQTLRKINHAEYLDLISKLEFCIGSYNFDKNPAGLIQYGHQALSLLKDIKKMSPKKVTKNVITSLEESLV
jgi:hypothetical protein